MMTFLARGIPVAGILLVLCMGRVDAQDSIPVTESLIERPLATRDALTALAGELERTGTQGSLLGRVQARLRDGDFRGGDQILLEVQGEPTLSDTFTVGADRNLTLPSPTVGRLSLQGVLRSEVQAKAEAYVNGFVSGAVVRARPLIRLSIQGDVMRAGFYGVPADAVLTDAVMAAGGTTVNANARKLSIERDGKPIMDGTSLQRAVADGRTLDEAYLRDGDQIVVGRRSEGGAGLRYAGIIATMAGAIFGLSRAF